MSKFDVTSSALNNQYSYENEDVTVMGNYIMDVKNETLQSVMGSVYKQSSVEGQQGDYIGNFNGYQRNGQIKYSVSEVSSQDAVLILTAIADIETNITGENSEE